MALQVIAGPVPADDEDEDGEEGAEGEAAPEAEAEGGEEYSSPTCAKTI
ncbi:hypothetical protein [uncultured Litoreibacter sp.]|nr:hypothetical protein [uncultured Litoreibacter sp.]